MKLFRENVYTKFIEVSTCELKYVRLMVVYNALTSRHDVGLKKVRENILEENWILMPDSQGTLKASSSSGIKSKVVNT